jgi:hydrophobic/amphiphilic exporter-1 (mainly G- bacteria), HAE1 family
MEQDYQNKPESKYELESTNSFFGFFIKHFRFSYLIIGAIFLFGITSLVTLPRESDPEVKIPFAVVSTVYSGASPEDIEYLITNELESELDNLDNLDEMTSSSNIGFSSIFVQFDPEVDMKEAMRNLRDAVDAAKPKLPQEAEDPIVTEIRANDFPLITFSLFGNYNNSQLQEYADLMQDKLENIPGVSKVPILGELKKEYQITIDQQKIQGYGLNISMVNNIIATSNIDMPLGNIEIDGYKYNLRTEGRFIEIEPLKDLIITYYQDKPIYLKDIAEIKDTFREKTTISRLSVNGSEPQNTISLQVYKKTGGNILKIVENAKQEVNKLKDNKRVPDDLDIKVTNDNSVYVEDSLNTLGKSAIQTIFLIILIIFIAMGWKESSLAVFVIPLAFLSSFFFMKLIGFTLNSMTTFSLVLSLGLLVDTSIVIMEGIFEAMEHKGMTALQAALHSLATFKLALISGTMTTIAAFVPMLLVSGIMGEYLKFIPLTVLFTLASSLFISLTILPMLASRILRRKKSRQYKAQESHQKSKIMKILDPEIPLLEKMLVPVKKRYEILLKKLLPSKKAKKTLILSFIGLFILSVLFPIIGLTKIEMFPEVDFDYFIINIETPTGTVIEKTEESIGSVEKYVKSIEESENYVIVIGASQGFYMMTDEASNKSNLANITVNLTDTDDREKTSTELAQEARDYFEQYNKDDIKITIPSMSGGPPTGSPIEVRVTGDDLDELSRIAKDIKSFLQELDGPIDIETDLKNTTGQFIINLDQNKLSYYNLTVANVAISLRQIIYGTSASEVTKEGQDIKIQVKYDEKNFNNIEDIKNILISSPKGQIALSAVSKITFEPSVSSIQHKDSNRVIRISSSLKGGYNASETFKELANKLEDYKLPKNYFIDYGGEHEDIAKSFQDMFTTLIVAVLLIITILVLQFNSFKQPLIIMFTLPLSLIGVIFGLTILRLNFSISAFIGVISLVGIVVNDAIVLISRINYNLRKTKMEFIPAIHEAAMSRLQPIILTTVTTVIGLLPLAFADPFWAGLSYSIIFGLTFATVLTLVVVPALYVMLEGEKEEEHKSLFKKIFKKLFRKKQLKLNLDK